MPNPAPLPASASTGMGDMATLQELIDLTPSQERAWKRIEKAVKDFRAAGGEFYSVLDTLSAYNGQHVASIDNDTGYHTVSVHMPSLISKVFPITSVVGIGWDKR